MIVKPKQQGNYQRREEGVVSTLLAKKRGVYSVYTHLGVYYPWQWYTPPLIQPRYKKANPPKLKGVVTFFTNSEFFKSFEWVDGYLGSYNHSTGTKNTPHLLYVDIWFWFRSEGCQKQLRECKIFECPSRTYRQNSVHTRSCYVSKECKLM